MKNYYLFNNSKTTTMTHFSRIDLAHHFAQELVGSDTFSDAANGLFLAAPRRTGKSTFLLNDLKPVLENLDQTVVYVDLWADKGRAVKDVLMDAIQMAILDKMGRFRKAVKASTFDEVGVPGIFRLKKKDVDPSSVTGLTLTEAFKKLRHIVKQPIILIVDEAQHSLSSPEGDDTMKALKSARDQMKNESEGRLSLIMSGSDRDKLLRLVNTNSAPFLGSTIRDFPLLGEEYIDFLGDRLRDSGIQQIDTKLLYEAFILFGARPQFLMDAISQAMAPFTNQEQSKSMEQRVFERAILQHAADQQEMESTFRGLDSIEQAVLWWLLQKKQTFRAFNAEALDFYNRVLGEEITESQVQGALNRLRAYDPPLVWKSQRGEYALEDSQMNVWYSKLLSAGAWPPGGGLKKRDLNAKPSRGRPRKNR